MTASRLPGGPRRRRADGRRDRGQMILLGAVVVSLLLVSLVVVFNSALFTETVDQESAVQAGNNAREFQVRVQSDTKSLLVRVNHAREYPNATGLYPNRSVLKRALRGNVSNYSDVLAEAYVAGGATYAAVRLHPNDSSYGSRVVQGRDGAMDAPGGGADWNVTDDRTTVGWASLNLNASELSSSESVDVRFTNGSGEFVEVSFRRNATGYVVVRTNDSAVPARNGTWTYRATSGRLVVDLLDGSVFGHETAFNGTGSLAGPVWVTIADGDAGVGRYSFVVEDPGAVGPAAGGPIGECPTAAGEPCRSPAVWTANVTVQYRSSQVAYEQRMGLEVYNGTS